MFVSLALSTKPTLSPMWHRMFPVAPALYGSGEEFKCFETRSQHLSPLAILLVFFFQLSRFCCSAAAASEAPAASSVSASSSRRICETGQQKHIGAKECGGGWYLHPRKRRTRALVLTGGPGAAPGGVASKTGRGTCAYRRGSSPIARGPSLSLSLSLSLSI